MKSVLRISALILFIGILTYSCKEDVQPNKPSETEINYNAAIKDNNQKPVINAVVNLFNSDKSVLIASDTSDENGLISFENVKTNETNIILQVSHKFYEDFSTNFNELDNNENNIITLENNEDCCGAANLVVKDEEGNPIKGVEIKVRQEMKVLKKDYTDENGKAEFKGLCLEEFEFRLSKDGYKVIEEMVKMEDCDNAKELSFKMQKNQSEEDTCCKGVMIFKPKDKDGNVLNGTKVYIYKDGKVIEDPIVKDGKVTVDGLCDGKYTIVYKLDGYENKEVQVELGCNEEKTFDHTLEKKDSDCCGGLVRVKVGDGNGNKIKNATVRLWKGSTKVKELKTDANGVVEFEELCESNDYSISISAEGYEGYEFEFDLGCDKEVTFEKNLKSKEECCDALLKFMVKDNDSKTALKDAKVTLKLNGKVIFEKRATNGDGIVEEDNLCKGKYTVIIERDGYKTIETTWNVEKCDDFQEHFWMQSTKDCCKGVMIFKPKDKDGNVLNGTKVYIYRDGKVIEDPIVKDGKVTVDGLCDGKYTIVYKLDGYENKEVQVELGCNEEKTFDHTLEKKDSDCCGGLVRVKVGDGNGNKIKNATVRLWKGSTKVKELKTDANGVVEFEELCESNDYSISISAEGYEGYEFDFDLGCDKEVTFEKNLKSKEECCDALLKFIVKDNDSKTALKDAKVTLKLNGKTIFEKRETNGDGIVVEDNLCKGKYTVIIEKDGYNTIETTWNVEKCDDFQEHFWMKK